MVSNESTSGDGFKISDSNLVCEPNVIVSNITSQLSGAVVKNGEGTKVTSGNVGTGYTITYNSKTYTVVKLGDTNGDGKISSADYVRVKNELRNKADLTNSQQEAADANNDGKISSADYVKIKNYLRGKVSIDI